MLSKINNPSVSVIIPTLNEAENIGPLLEQLTATFQSEYYNIEILITDGGSTDETQKKVEAWSVKKPVRFISANSKQGLAGDVLIAARQAQGEAIVIMDADLSHPPGIAPKLVKPILEKTQDVVIGSRYVKGGKTSHWPLLRKIISRVAALFTWPFIDVYDSNSGFFAVSRERLLAVSPQAKGFKILLEVLLGSNDNKLRIKEIPILFHCRSCGHSKMDMKQSVLFLGRLTALIGGTINAEKTKQFVLVSLLGVPIDLGIFHYLLNAGLRLSTSHIFSFFIASGVSYIFYNRWIFSIALAKGYSFWRRHIRFFTLCLLMLFLRGGILELFIQFGWPAERALLTAILIITVLSFIGITFFVFPNVNRPSYIRWRLAAIGLVGYVLFLHLVYLGLPNLLPEEAYYWNYAQHPAFGYLDHPPMVAWLIMAGTKLFGNNEFGIRIGTFLCWLITSGFYFAFARNLFGKESAFRSVIFLTLLPGFFMFSFFSTPDAPLFACWAGALFFIERALLSGRRLAWWGFGLCIGLGMLSKYTIALLGPSVVLFVLLNKRSRLWLLRFEPFAAILLIILFFMPVIIWNAEHGWASFIFQSSRRITANIYFSFHILLGCILGLLTPWGAAGVCKIIFSRSKNGNKQNNNLITTQRQHLFITIFTLVPLSVFVLFSIIHQPKYSWTGPLWLAIFPALALLLLQEKDSNKAPVRQQFWMRAFIIFALIQGGLLHYFSIGLPGIAYSKDFTLTIDWKELGKEIERIENKISEETNKKPLLVGMDKYFIASELAFYRRSPKENVKERVARTSSINLFNENGLMYNWWINPRQQIGKIFILISKTEYAITQKKVGRWFKYMGPKQGLRIFKDNLPSGKIFYRIAYGYLGAPR